MNNMAKKLHQADQQSFDTWFNRWIEHVQIEQRLIRSAQKGYHSLVVYERSYESDPYLIRRFEDKRFVKRLQAELPDLHVEAQHYQAKNRFGFSIEVYKVLISWDATDKIAKGTLNATSINIIN